VEGSCEHGIEPSGSIKCWGVLDWLHTWQLLRKGSAPAVSKYLIGKLLNGMLTRSESPPPPSVIKIEKWHCQCACGYVTNNSMWSQSYTFCLWKNKKTGPSKNLIDIYPNGVHHKITNLRTLWEVTALTAYLGALGSIWLGHYYTSRKVTDSSPGWGGFFNLPNTSSHTMALGSTQPLTEMSTRNLFGVKKRPTRSADNLAAICVPNVWKCGSLNLSQP
jgi:hypothetical protein